MFLEKRASSLSGAIICVSEYDRQLALRLGVGNESLITRIHNGVPDVRADQRSIVKSSGPIRVVCVARLDVPKEHVLLLEAMATIDKLPWVLELIGDGPLTAVARQRARDLGIADRVMFSGLCNDVPSRLAVADVFVLASAWEGLPLSILEAMRAGLPVVASDVGGVAESVNDGVTGFLVPKGDKAVLADRLMRLLVDATLRKQMGRAGRTIYERDFAFAVMYQRTLKIYTDLLARKVNQQC